MLDSTLHYTLEEYQRRLTDRLLQGRREWVQLSTINSVHMSTGSSAQLSPVSSTQLSAANSLDLPVDKERASPEQIKERDDSAEQEAADARRQAEEAKQQNTEAKEAQEENEAKQLQEDLMEARKKASEADQQLKQTRQEVLLTRSQMERLQQELLKADRRTKEVSLEAEDKIQQLRLQLDQVDTARAESTAQLYHWEVPREEVQLLETVIHKGDWGVTKKAMFHGLTVAAMSLREAVSTTDFNSAMTLASCLHHPALVQFIGATTKEDPLILTELVATTLSRQLEAGPLTRSQILSVGKDIAAALSYLHHRRPQPIVHGYINSTTVLLERNDQCLRAKLYSSVLLHPVPPRSLTSSPYAAPELTTANSSCTPESDIFSFGVLLTEMSIREHPAAATTKREQQIRRINWPGMASLLLKCTSSRHTDRPTIEMVIHDLKHL